MFVIVPAASGVTVMLAVVDAPGFKLPTLHVIVRSDREQPGEAETKLTPSGSVSVTVTPVAISNWLLLVTLRVYVRLLPTAPGLADAVLIRARSTSALMVLLNVDVLLKGVGSVRELLTFTD